MTTPATPLGRSARRLAGLLLAAYAVMVLAGKLSVVLKFTLPLKLGDVGEFLLVLAAMAFFVFGLLQDEQSASVAPPQTAKEES